MIDLVTVAVALRPHLEEQIVELAEHPGRRAFQTKGAGALGQSDRRFLVLVARIFRWMV